MQVRSYSSGPLLTDQHAVWSGKCDLGDGWRGLPHNLEVCLPSFAASSIIPAARSASTTAVATGEGRCLIPSTTLGILVNLVRQRQHRPRRHELPQSRSQGKAGGGPSQIVCMSSLQRLRDDRTARGRKEHTLRLLSGAYQDFTDKGLRWLHNQGRNN